MYYTPVKMFKYLWNLNRFWEEFAEDLSSGA